MKLSRPRASVDSRGPQKTEEVKGISLTTAEAEQFLQAAKETCPEYHPLFLLALISTIITWLAQQRGGAMTGSPARIREMLRFAALHKVEPQVEMYPMSKVNDALEHLHSGKARYRIVLKNDF